MRYLNVVSQMYAVNADGDAREFTRKVLQRKALHLMFLPVVTFYPCLCATKHSTSLNGAGERPGFAATLIDDQCPGKNEFLN